MPTLRGLEGRFRDGIFVDSSALFALVHRADVSHADTLRILQRAGRERQVLITTNFVIAEAHALILVRLGYAVATTFLRESAESAISVERVKEDDEAAARAIIFRYTDKTFSLVDALSFVVMERVGLSTALTFDSDFAQYGFQIARP